MTDMISLVSLVDTSKLWKNTANEYSSSKDITTGKPEYWYDERQLLVTFRFLQKEKSSKSTSLFRFGTLSLHDCAFQQDLAPLFESAATSTRMQVPVPSSNDQMTYFSEPRFVDRPKADTSGSIENSNPKPIPVKNVKLSFPPLNVRPTKPNKQKRETSRRLSEFRSFQGNQYKERRSTIAATAPVRSQDKYPSPFRRKKIGHDRMAAFHIDNVSVSVVLLHTLEEWTIRCKNHSSGNRILHNGMIWLPWQNISSRFENDSIDYSAFQKRVPYHQPSLMLATVEGLEFYSYDPDKSHWKRVKTIQVSLCNIWLAPAFASKELRMRSKKSVKKDMSENIESNVNSSCQQDPTCFILLQVLGKGFRMYSINTWSRKQSARDSSPVYEPAMNFRDNLAPVSLSVDVLDPQNKGGKELWSNLFDAFDSPLYAQLTEEYQSVAYQTSKIAREKAIEKYLDAFSTIDKQVDDLESQIRDLSDKSGIEGLRKEKVELTRRRTFMKEKVSYLKSRTSLSNASMATAEFMHSSWDYLGPWLCNTPKLRLKNVYDGDFALSCSSCFGTGAFLWPNFVFNQQTGGMSRLVCSLEKVAEKVIQNMPVAHLYTSFLLRRPCRAIIKKGANCGFGSMSHITFTGWKERKQCLKSIANKNSLILLQCSSIGKAIVLKVLKFLLQHQTHNPLCLTAIVTIFNSLNNIYYQAHQLSLKLANQETFLSTIEPKYAQGRINSDSTLNSCLFSNKDSQSDILSKWIYNINLTQAEIFDIRTGLSSYSTSVVMQHDIYTFLFVPMKTYFLNALHQILLEKTEITSDDLEERSSSLERVHRWFQLTFMEYMRSLLYFNVDIERYFERLFVQVMCIFSIDVYLRIYSPNLRVSFPYFEEIDKVFSTGIEDLYLDAHKEDPTYPSQCTDGIDEALANEKKAVVTCAINGVLTDPQKFPMVPVTPEQMAQECKDAFDAGATVAHIHFRDQREKMGHLPTWDAEVAKDISDAIREKVPEMMLNFTTGTIGDKGPMGGGPLGPTGGPIACLEAGRPEMAALNSGSLNYLKTKKDGTWAWPPMTFQNPVEKIETMMKAMEDFDIIPECECFDTGIVRTIKMFEENGLMKQPITVSLVMGVASGMPAKAEWLPLLVDEISDETRWQVIAIGRADETWPLLRKAAELGGNVRTGLEDTFYRLDGSRATGNGELIQDLVEVLRETGREPASPAEARVLLGLN
eukprot:g2818.t1